MRFRHAVTFRAAAALCALAVTAAACSADDDIAEPARTTLPPAEAPPDPDDATAGPATTAPTTTVAATATQPPPDDELPTVTEPVPDDEMFSGPSVIAELPWGNFTLAPRISAKLAGGERLNFVLSIGATGRLSTGEVLSDGWSRAGADIGSEHGADVNARVIGPNRPDAAAQIATIDELVGSGDIDCLAVEASDSGAFVGIIDKAVDAGIPVFGVGGDSPDSKRFAFYGFDDFEAGRLAGATVGRWSVDSRILMRKAGVLTGDAQDPRSQARMEGFVEGLRSVHSAMEFVNGPDTAESQGFDPESVYTASEAWILGHPDVDIVFHTDEGLEMAARAVASHLLYGDVYAAGFHMSEQVADYIREGVVVAALPAGLWQQAHRAGLACGRFLLEGAHDTGFMAMDPLVATRDNVEEVDWALLENQ